MNTFNLDLRNAITIPEGECKSIDKVTDESSVNIWEPGWATIPNITVTAKDAEDDKTGRKIAITGCVSNREDCSKREAGHGLLYTLYSRIGSKELTVDSTYKTKVNFGSYSDTNTFTYTITANTVTTKYVARAYFLAKDRAGSTKYYYGNQIYFTHS